MWFRLRTKLVLSLIFTTAVLIGGSLLAAQIALRNRARVEISSQIENALKTFEEYAQQRQKLLLQANAVTADLPNIRAAMTTNHEQTIQDASGYYWQFVGSDLFLLADPSGKLMALHSTTGDFKADAAHELLMTTLGLRRSKDWWFGEGRLYEVFLQNIYLGRTEDERLLGVLVAGFAVDQQFTAAVSRIMSSDVAFRYGDVVVASSLSAARQQELSNLPVLAHIDEGTSSDEIRLEGERFIESTVFLSPQSEVPVTLTVLKSYDEATLFLRKLNQLFIGVGLVALIAGSGLMFLISPTLTRPIEKLSSGVAALQKGDFSYPLKPEARDEVGELTSAFDKMRKSLRESQQHLLHAERLATIGRMASTISHDLRHPLTTILAYAELLSESNLDERERTDIYRQIRLSVNNMAELIASLLEFSKAQEALQLSYGDCVETLQDTMRDVRLRPEFRGIQMTLQHEGVTQGWFDFAKLDRAFHNLLKNACEAVNPESGSVRVTVLGTRAHVEISVSDNGAGIPEEIREEVFQPFVSLGKPDGTGLGLAVVQKIVQDHGGQVAVDATGPDGTIFKLTLPLIPPSKVAVSQAS